MSWGRPGPDPYPPPWPPNGHPPPYPRYPPYPPPRQDTSLLGMVRDLRDAEWPPLRVLLRAGRPRIHGCAWALLLLPCTWFLTLPLMVGYVFARSARSRAHRLFPPRGHRRIEDPQVTRVQRIRAWTAAVMSLLLLAVYGRPGDFGQAQEQYFLRLAITPPLLLLSAPVVIAVLFRWASPGARAGMRPRVRAAGRSALWYLAAVTSIPLYVLLVFLAVEGGVLSAKTVYAIPWIGTALVLPLVWVLFFLWSATGPAIRTGFNTAAVHEALPALLTGVLVWEFAVISLVTGGPPPGPPLIQVLALLGGPASVTAVSWWEIHRLRTRHGVVLRA
ncbi:hypothetical protein GCM10010129_26400 [Streptomyces fumigatiscleroticus]|nr:hypothetical protein GCM10010129_26400 [Streptomyces fumigatiscleroticus]